jgi:hypothetical protein
LDAYRPDASARSVFCRRPIIHNEWGGSSQVIRLPLHWVIVTLRSSEAGSAHRVWVDFGFSLDCKELPRRADCRSPASGPRTAGSRAPVAVVPALRGAARKRTFGQVWGSCSDVCRGRVCDGPLCDGETKNRTFASWLQAESETPPWRSNGAKQTIVLGSCRRQVATLCGCSVLD